MQGRVAVETEDAALGVAGLGGGDPRLSREPGGDEHEDAGKRTKTSAHHTILPDVAV